MRLEFEPNVTAFPLVENEMFDEVTLSSEFQDLLKKGIAAAQNGDRDHARTLLLHATQLEPKSEDAWMWLASISEYPEELLAFLNNVLDLNPENKRAKEWKTATCSLLAKTFVQRGLNAASEAAPEQAAKCFDQALAHDDNCELAWFHKALMSDSEDEKEELLRRTLSINAENNEAQDVLDAMMKARAVSAVSDARSAFIAGNASMALDILNEVLENDPNNLDAWMLRSHMSPSVQEKLYSLEKVLEIDPSNPAARSSYDFLATTVVAEAPVEQAANTTEEHVSEPVSEYSSETQEADARIEEPQDVQEDESEQTPEVAEYLEPEQMEDRVEEQVYIQEEVSEQSLEMHGVGTDNDEFQNKGPEYVQAETVEYTNEMSEPSEPEHAESRSDEPEYVSEKVVDTAHFLEPEPSAAQQEDAAHFAEEFRFPEPEPMRNTEDHVFNSSEAPFDHFAESNPIHTTDPDEITEDSYVPSQMFAPVDDHHNAYADTVDSLPSLNDMFVASEAPADLFGQPVENTPAPVFQDPYDENYNAETDPAQLADLSFSEQVSGSACPFCWESNEKNAFECQSCHATMTLSDIESLLSNPRANREVVQHAVTQMEAEWNMREFDQNELTSLGVGHFNLQNFDSGLKYLQEAARLNPNDVILSGHLNTIAIRLNEIRRQEEIHQSTPKGRKILVVDDSATVRKLISGKLEKSGHSVVCAEDGVEGLARISEDIPDLVLLDITMPRMDGYEVCRQIRSNPASKHVPVVMISGKDGFFDKVRGRMAGTTGYVTKPFGPETLMKALETYLVQEEAFVVAD